jgi:cytoskeletal protein CcmA (bactofilin family)
MSDSQITVLGPDTHIKGEMTFAGGARLLGVFEGRITTKGELHVGAEATCKASLEAGRVVVDGTIEGDVLAHERVELNATAQVRGDLTAHSLVVAEGAVFVGHCKVGPAATIAEESAPAGTIGQPARRPVAPPSIQTKPVRPMAPAALSPEAAARAERIARSAAELTNDGPWQQLATA